MIRTERRGAAGFSLAEVVVALGLLASVLISVAGLLVLGNRQVSSGRSRSEALALARDVVEQMKSWSFDRTTAAFDGECGCDLATAACAIDSTCSVTAAPWQALLMDTLGNGRIEILLESLDGSALSAASGVRITVEVGWNEATLHREVRLATVRM